MRRSWLVIESDIWHSNVIVHKVPTCSTLLLQSVPHGQWQLRDDVASTTYKLGDSIIHEPSVHWSKPWWLVVSSLIKIQPSELFVSQRLIPIPNKMEQRYSILVAILVKLLKGSGTISRKPINLTSSILCCLPTSRSGRKRLGHQDRLVCYEFFRWWWS